MNARDALEVVRQQLETLRNLVPDIEADSLADSAIGTLTALVERAGEPVAVEYRLWDSQWVNVVNHDDCYGGYDMDDAIEKAVRLTEEAMKSNVERNSWPPPRVIPPTAPGASHE